MSSIASVTHSSTEDDRTVATSQSPKEPFLIDQSALTKAVSERSYDLLKAQSNQCSYLLQICRAWLAWRFLFLHGNSRCLSLYCKFQTLSWQRSVAAGQYAVLYAAGQLKAEDLKNYKNGLCGLEAHADLVMDTALGQCLFLCCWYDGK